MTAEPKVYVVDDDAAVRSGLAAMFDAAGLGVETYESATQFLSAYRPEWNGCVILDVSMPAMTGPELQAELNRRGVSLPIIFLTAHGDIPTTVRTIKAGALDFMTKPADGAALLARVRAALARNAQTADVMATLTEREREIAVRVAGGQSSKEIARELDISHRTVEVHRARVMHKMKAGSTVELAEIIRSAGLVPVPPGKRR